MKNFNIDVVVEEITVGTDLHQVLYQTITE